MQPTKPNAVTQNTYVEQVYYLNSLVHLSPVSIPVHCRLWNVEEAGKQSVVWSEQCGVQSVERKAWGVNYRV